ncbi:MAG: hypothetical protein ABJF04_18500 [Reichenbachiella sp.]|uniref:hypothetical protein n=1 Tax=Reichenbachiella sp. TaxID=2184521 RepID=UPI0032670EF7
MCVIQLLCVIRAMESWNPEHLSKSFLFQANEAERYCKEVKSKIDRTPTYKQVFDEHLAKFYVFNYLHDRTFLETKELFIKELKNMLSFEVNNSGCFDFETFERYRKLYINQLINNHSH